MKKQFSIQNNQSGSMMISLMIFVVVSLAIVISAVLLVIDSTITASNQQIGTAALTVAESGIENAMLRLLRDPSYTGETIIVGDGQAVVTVTGSSPITIRSVGTLGTFERTVVATSVRINGVLTVTSWKEI